ncbi:gamma-glutamyl-gamma-aminobutyrate hydrolase family protein [Cellulomonas sp. ACRRI]|uniref:gamma-glutamyl-gamma-aminobutyrate hydrolase family protein n=1 Tax=Cellulomonas sp. ACRRI TaxID=2918188 RepID=UPI001EF1CF91|nr:gamma-glutamyl-gamma-aminobutyrate hydrolase family protein [Cellulomonas sp. ACRRI]MCG7284880.1 gamma-glutamyl-gamma-aminobutyrate hydrolase family protein [Cellulomonas sp. ACRRI]
MTRPAPVVVVLAGETTHADPYLRAVGAAGGHPVLLRPSAGRAAWDAADADALVLAGGASVAPERYDRGYEAGVAFDPEHDRDEFELAVLATPRAQAVPVLGICRGLQVLNVHHGGTLWQYLPHHGLADQHAPAVPRDALVHQVRATAGALRDIAGEDPFPVNSIHDQAVRDLGAGLRVTAETADGVVEGVESLDGRVHAVQWHPEELAPTHRVSAALFASLVRRAHATRTAGSAVAVPA